MTEAKVFLLRNPAGEYKGRGGYYRAPCADITLVNPFAKKSGAASMRNRLNSDRGLALFKGPWTIVTFKLVEVEE